MSKDIENIPQADMLMGSMRSMGYTFESAVADIIDNSISAHCSFVKMFFPKTPMEPMAVGILDDGEGMMAGTLFEAMRYGSTASEGERSEDDLGRFGLGLKSASLSQCRILTVVSKCNGSVSSYTWDYNYIRKKKDWVLKEHSSDEIKKIPYVDTVLALEHGTLVVWQDFDILAKSSDGQVYNTLNELKKCVGDSNALIFHRFLSEKKLTIRINNETIKPQDPFLESHKKTTSKKEITIALNDSMGKERSILVKPFVLPFATDLAEKDKKLLGGIENLRSKQGFYIYRNNRLIIWGTWFGMKPRSELTKNARIRVDIPNTLDDIWSIDIKKQTASIPKRIQQQLKKTVMDAMEISINKQTHRGRQNKVNDDIDYIWDRMEGRDNKFYYQINRDSRIFKFVRDKMSEEDYVYLEMLVGEIEKNIPTQQMYVDKSNEAILVEENDSRFDDVYQMALTMIDMMQKIGQTYKDAIDSLMKSEPFCNYKKLYTKLIETFENHDNRTTI